MGQEQLSAGTEQEAVFASGRQGILKRGAKARSSLGLSEVQQLATREQK